MTCCTRGPFPISTIAATWPSSFFSPPNKFGAVFSGGPQTPVILGGWSAEGAASGATCEASGPSTRFLPITLRQGSPAHLLYMAVGWALAIVPFVYILVAHRFGGRCGSVDKASRIVQINDVIAFAVAILGLNLVIGYSGQLSLGQSAFVGLGAYTTVILVADHDWSYFADAAGVGRAVLRRRPARRHPRDAGQGLYLAIVTLAIAYVFPELVLRSSR